MFKKLRELKEYGQYVQFRRIHLGSREVIERWQLKHVRTLAAHVSKHVSLYAGIFADHGVASTSLISLRDLERLPITDKSMYIGKPVEEYTDSSRSRSGHWVTTSGTSGKPFTILRHHQIHAPMHQDFILYRFLFQGRPWHSKRSEKVVRIWPKPSHLENSVDISIADLLGDTEKTVRYLESIDPDIIETYAGLLYVLAASVKKWKVSLKPRYMVSCAEQMSPALRTAVEDALGCKVFNRYGMEEFGAIATECPMHDGLHIHSESFVIEIVDEHGAVVPEGRYGRVVITDLFNSKMPFIRYDTRDHGKLSWEKCACGQGAPRLWLEGRYSAFLMLNGRRIHHLEFDVALEIFMNSIIQYQIVKEGSDKIVINIIPATGFDEVAREKVIARMRSLVGPNVQVSIQVVDAIPKSPRGKSQIVVDMAQ